MHEVLHLILRKLSLKIRGKVRNKNRRVVERITKVSPNLNLRIRSVIFVTKQDIHISIAIGGKGITKTGRVSLNKQIMKIMMMTILLMLLVIILLFYEITRLLISYQTRAYGQLTLVLHCMLHQGRSYLHLILVVTLECSR